MNESNLRALLESVRDGSADIAVGAPGEEKVYLFFGGDFEKHIVLEPKEPEVKAGFGGSLAARDLDSVPRLGR